MRLAFLASIGLLVYLVLSRPLRSRSSLAHHHRPRSSPRLPPDANLLSSQLPNASRYTPSSSSTQRRCRGVTPGSSRLYCSSNVAVPWSTPHRNFGIESTVTATEPPFTFAYSRRDSAVRDLRASGMIEPDVTRGWRDAVGRCCASGGRVIDVGGNYGWYTLYSLALGCSVTVFEPIPLFQDVLRLGLSLNPGFAERTTLFGNVVYSDRGSFAVRLPLPGGNRKRELGMAGMLQHIPRDACLMHASYLVTAQEVSLNALSAL